MFTSGWTLAILSGLLLSASLLFSWSEILIWIGFIPIFLFFKNFSKQKKSGRFFIFYTFLAGFIYFAITLRWIFGAYPLNWILIESKTSGFLIVFLIWFFSSVAMAFPWSLGAFLIAKLNLSESLQKISITSLGALAILALLEYFRTWFFGIFWAGKNMLFGPHWTMGSPVYALAENPLFLKISSYSGIYSIFFIILFINFSIFLIFFKSRFVLYKKLTIGIAVLSVLSFSSFMYGENKNSGSEIPVLVVQTQNASTIALSVDEQLNAFKEQLTLINSVKNLDQPPSVIVFPENSNFFKNLSIFLNESEIKNFFNDKFSKPTVIIDNSTVLDTEKGVVSRLIYLDSEKGPIGFYDKSFLIPAGEYMPYSIQFFAALISPKILRDFATFRQTDSSLDKSLTIEFKDEDKVFRLGALLCSALMSPNLFKETSAQNPNMLIALISNGVFRGARSLVEHNIAMAKFRAAESGKSLIVASNFGLSYLISDNGFLLSKAQNSDSQLFTANVVLTDKTTWYTKFGDISILLFLGVLIISTFLLRMRD